MSAGLGGSAESVRVFSTAIGKTISDLALHNEQLCFTFTDGTQMRLYDGDQSCGENRYMSTDDVLTDFIGATLVNAETREAPGEADGYEEHDCEFLVVTTSKGAFTMVNHNQHNGYYGGILVRASEGGPK